MLRKRFAQGLHCFANTWRRAGRPASQTLCAWQGRAQGTPYPPVELAHHTHRSRWPACRAQGASITLGHAGLLVGLLDGVAGWLACTLSATPTPYG
jgi:hypothetical protein